MFLVREIFRSICRRKGLSLLTAMTGVFLFLSLGIYIGNLNNIRNALETLGEKLPVTVQITNANGSQAHAGCRLEGAHRHSGGEGGCGQEAQHGHRLLEGAHVIPGGNQRPGQGIAGFGHFRGQEVDGHGVEAGLRTAHHNRGDQPDPGIRPVIFEQIQHQPGGRGRGKQLDEDQGHQIRRDAKSFRQPPGRFSQKVQQSGSPQDTHPHHQPDEGGHDLDYGFQAVCRPFDKIFVNVVPVYDPIGYNIKNKGRDDNPG